MYLYFPINFVFADDTLGSYSTWNQLEWKLCQDLRLRMGIGRWLLTTFQIHKMICSAYKNGAQARAPGIISYSLHLYQSKLYLFSMVQLKYHCL